MSRAPIYQSLYCTCMWYVLKYRIGVQDVANKTTIFHDGHHVRLSLLLVHTTERLLYTDQLTRLPVNVIATNASSYMN